MKSKVLALHLLAFAFLGAGRIHAQSSPAAGHPASASPATTKNISVASDPAAEERAANSERDILLEQSDGTGNQGKSSAGSASLLTVVFVLLLLSGGLYIAILFVRRSRPGLATAESPIKVLASAPLGPGRGIHAVSCGSKVWLVAATEYSISLVDTVDDPDVVRELFRHAESSPPAPVGFPSPRRVRPLGFLRTGFLQPGTRGFGAGFEDFLASLGSVARGRRDGAARGDSSPGSSAPRVPGASDAEAGDYIAGQRRRLDKYRKGDEL